MEEKKFTLNEILTDAVKTISNLAVPVALDSISTPLRRVAVNLQACIDYLAKKEKEDSEKEGADNGAE